MAHAVRGVDQAPGMDRDRAGKPRVELDDVPVYVALVAWNVSPPLTEHVVSECCETFVASNVALAACTDGARCPAARDAGPD